jgi:pimeloyl-ACP methyl ester carboxylesterase
MPVSEVEGDGFYHLVIQRMDATSSSRLHVYIEGDGIPWSGNQPSPDPSPRNTLALRLADQDPTDFVYIGRPCYFFPTKPPRCSPEYWTSHRYSEEVIQSMASAIQRVREPRHAEVVLIGHSGGGALAALLDSRIEGVVGVITVAANLDIDAWTEFHGYDPLVGSLNPIQQSRNSNVTHFQIVGGRDTTVPLTTSIGYADAQPNVELISYEKFDHACCWEEEWPAILKRLSMRLGESAIQQGLRER